MEKQVFHFKNYSIPIEIEGMEFQMDCSIDARDYIKSTATELRKLAEQVASGSKNTEDVVAYGCEVIDCLLGDGAAAALLNGRKNRLADVMDVCEFLIQVAAKYRSERMKNQKDRAQKQAGGST